MKETFLIPNGFEGRITVVFNQPNATQIPIENDRRIYKIPEDGILITSSKIETGILHQKYYYIDKSGNRTKINILDLDKGATEIPMVVRYGTVGVYGNSDDVNPIEFLESTIASKKNIDSISDYKYISSFEQRIMEKLGRKF
ncbi:DUF6843 domain-containing protein [Flavobacterium noncentrifugens]|uniref:DUF6843 domain-containing protein n=1 Tax=Flavobacterium noncentrifugens TaxID=1128970 RepID=UPI0014777A65|nr:hypothetical protein [Flavobacterium noncentrifugens]